MQPNALGVWISNHEKFIHQQVLTLEAGITNLWMRLETIRASQSHPKLPRDSKNHPRITQSQPEPARASHSEARVNRN